MNYIVSPFNTLRYFYRYLLGLVCWLLGWLLMFGLDGKLDLSNLSMILVLTSALAAMWLPVVGTLVFGIVSVMTFNWAFVPPRGTFAIDFHQHTMLLIVMFVVNIIVAFLMMVLRDYAHRAEQHLLANEMLREWGDKLRDVDSPQTCITDLQQLLVRITNKPIVVMVLHNHLPTTDDINSVTLMGDADNEQKAGLWYCLRNGQALGADTGRYQNLADLYFPLRGKTMTYGAALIMAGELLNKDLYGQIQSLCDQMGAALERHSMQHQQQLAEQLAHEQSLRTTFLAAISHDYRTPLATIMGAASSLEQQGEKLAREQQQQLAHRIVDEAERLRQMTNNILQLARLDAPGIDLHCDWESAEELIGSLIQRNQAPSRQRRLQVSVTANLPLLWCDSLLMSQLLDNLLDNAFKYSVPDTPINIAARLVDNNIILSICDHGPGIPIERQQIIFDVFQRLPRVQAAIHTTTPIAIPGITKNHVSTSAGAGIGLALCRAIANAHGGELRLQSSASGSCFECLLPVRPQPDLPAESTL